MRPSIHSADEWTDVLVIAEHSLHYATFNYIYLSEKIILNKNE